MFYLKCKYIICLSKGKCKLFLRHHFGSHAKKKLSPLCKIRGFSAEK